MFDFDIVNPKTNKRSPFYNKKKGLFYFPTTIRYKYYLECSKFNNNTNDTEFYILLSKEKFNENCNKCSYDNYGRCQMRLNGSIKEYVINESKERGNLIMDYIESKPNYDIFNLI